MGCGPGSVNGGEGGIRTLDRGLSPYSGLANRRPQPLGDFSALSYRWADDYNRMSIADAENGFQAFHNVRQNVMKTGRNGYLIFRCSRFFFLTLNGQVYADSLKAVTSSAFVSYSGLPPCLTQIRVHQPNPPNPCSIPVFEVRLFKPRIRNGRVHGHRDTANKL